MGRRAKAKHDPRLPDRHLLALGQLDGVVSGLELDGLVQPGTRNAILLQIIYLLTQRGQRDRLTTICADLSRKLERLESPRYYRQPESATMELAQIWREILAYQPAVRPLGRPTYISPRFMAERHKEQYRAVIRAGRVVLREIKQVKAKLRHDAARHRPRWGFACHNKAQIDAPEVFEKIPPGRWPLAVPPSHHWAWRLIRELQRTVVLRIPNDEPFLATLVRSCSSPAELPPERTFSLTPVRLRPPGQAGALMTTSPGLSVGDYLPDGRKIWALELHRSGGSLTAYVDPVPTRRPPEWHQYRDIGLRALFSDPAHPTWGDLRSARGVAEWLLSAAYGKGEIGAGTYYDVVKKGRDALKRDEAALRKMTRLRSRTRHRHR